MTNIVRSIRSTLNLFLAMLELFVSTLLAIKVFSSDVDSENGLVGCVVDFFGAIGTGSAWLVESSEIAGSISFLVVILIFMVFSQALFLAIPTIIQREHQNSARVNRRQSFKYRKKRFAKNRFLKHYY